eukprot:CAMPEP_0170315522 /NCGR_PEP_ID=MMETSP0116_2-20130129/58362_1 /TAXON_ID=400756 /ORGANISM="Durinskia baltica, Strain CSIRO CS-38" /LENGTH=71 /DNA_ID=CAMNT_0010568027 /DNA_START=26 /DNA_END=238 /DNA_ORIENTATION=-
MASTCDSRGATDPTGAFGVHGVTAAAAHAQAPEKEEAAVGSPAALSCARGCLHWRPSAVALGRAPRAAWHS